MKNVLAILALLNNTSAVQVQNNRWIEVPDNFTSLAELEADGTKIPLKTCEMSSAFNAQNSYPCQNAFSGGNQFTLTKAGVGEWWRAPFEGGQKMVEKVRILNRFNCCGDRLGGTSVFIGGKLCGNVPDVTEQNKWYDIKCDKPVEGRNVELRTNKNTYLNISGIEVFEGAAQAPADTGKKCFRYSNTKGCTNGHNLKKVSGVTLQQCQTLCDEMGDVCKGFEYFVKSGLDKTSSSYKEGDCMPNDTDKPDQSCNAGFYQMQLWERKGEAPCQLNPQDLLPAFHELGMGLHATVVKFQDQKVQADAADHEKQKMWSTHINDNVKMSLVGFAVRNLGLPEAAANAAMQDTETFRRQAAGGVASLVQDYDRDAHHDALQDSTDDKLTSAYITAAFELHHGLERYAKNRFEQSMETLQAQRKISDAMLHDVTQQLMEFGVKKLNLNEKLVRGDLSKLDE